jgi:hypothetical protein
MNKTLQNFVKKMKFSAKLSAKLSAKHFAETESAKEEFGVILEAPPVKTGLYRNLSKSFGVLYFLCHFIHG